MKGTIVWLTGLPGSGKTTVAEGALATLWKRGDVAYGLDGDKVRKGLCSDLGLSVSDRIENIRRVGAVARIIASQRATVIVALISPFARARVDQCTQAESEGIRFLEVWVRCPVEMCMMRDPKGLYLAQRTGKIKGLTGVDAPFEEPECPDITLYTDQETAAGSIDRLIRALDAEEVV